MRWGERGVADGTGRGGGGGGWDGAGRGGGPPTVSPALLTSCRSATVLSGTRLYTWLLSAMGGSASSNSPRGNSRASSSTASRADPAGERGVRSDAEGRPPPRCRVATVTYPGSSSEGRDPRARCARVAMVTCARPQRIRSPGPRRPPPLHSKGLRCQELSLATHSPGLPASGKARPETGSSGAGR